MENEDRIVLNVVSTELQASRNSPLAPCRDGSLKRPSRRRKDRSPGRGNKKARSTSSSLESSSVDEASESSDEDWTEPVEAEDSSDEDDPVWAPNANQSPRKMATGVGARGRKLKTCLGRTNFATSKIQVPVQTSSLQLEPVISEDSRDTAWIFHGYTEGIDPSCYNNSSFILLKTDVKTQKRPTLWRIDGKTLLQKYEPVIWEGKPAYRSVSTYTSWNPAKKGLYVPVAITYLLHGKLETVVSFSVESVLLPVEASVAKKVTQEGLSSAEIMDVYLQTLLSQALDSNFMTEIKNEKDDYFLSSLDNIEVGVIRPRLVAVENDIVMVQEVRNALHTFPSYKVTPTIAHDQTCKMCSAKNPTRKISLMGSPYIADTLLPREANLDPPTWVLCYTCIDGALIYHQLFHFRYSIYTECRKKVEERGDLSTCDGPVILKEILADQPWMSQMRRMAVLCIAEAEQFVQHGYS